MVRKLRERTQSCWPSARQPASPTQAPGRMWCSLKWRITYIISHRGTLPLGEVGHLPSGYGKLGGVIEGSFKVSLPQRTVAELGTKK